jgi:hypothetical protein
MMIKLVYALGQSTIHALLLIVFVSATSFAQVAYCDISEKTVKYSGANLTTIVSYKDALGKDTISATFLDQSTDTHILLFPQAKGVFEGAPDRPVPPMKTGDFKSDFWAHNR